MVRPTMAQAARDTMELTPQSAQAARLTAGRSHHASAFLAKPAGSDARAKKGEESSRPSAPKTCLLHTHLQHACAKWLIPTSFWEGTRHAKTGQTGAGPPKAASLPKCEKETPTSVSLRPLRGHVRPRLRATPTPTRDSSLDLLQRSPNTKQESRSRHCPKGSKEEHVRALGALQGGRRGPFRSIAENGRQMPNSSRNRAALHGCRRKLIPPAWRAEADLAVTLPGLSDVALFWRLPHMKRSPWEASGFLAVLPCGSRRPNPGEPCTR